MRVLHQQRTPLTSAAVQLVFVAVAGYFLITLLGWAPPFLAVGAAIGALLGLLFLRRPDLGLGIVLLVRASTDIFLRPGPFVQGGARSLLMNPNVGLILILIVGGGLFILARNVPFLGLPGGRLFALLLLTGLVGMLRSESIINSMNNWLPPVSALIVYALAAHLFRTPPRQRLVVTMIGVSFLFPAILGFRQALFSGGQFYRGIGLSRVVATFVGPNAFAIYLVMILAVFVVQMFGQSRRVRIWSTLIVLSSGVLLVQTFTRVAWVGAAIVVLTIGLLRERRLLVLLPLAAVIAFVTVPEITGRVTNPLGGTFADRVQIWRGSYAAWLYLTSLGGGFLTTLLDRLSGLGPGARYALVAMAEGRVIGAHNDYLGILYDFGIMGLLSYMALLWTLTMTAYRVWRRTRDNLAAGAVPLSFLALVLAYWVMSLTDNLFGMTVNQVYFWSLAGLTVALAEFSVEETGQEPQRVRKVTPPGWSRPAGLRVAKGLVPRP